MFRGTPTVLLLVLLLWPGHAVAAPETQDAQIRALIHQLVAVRGEMQDRLEAIYASGNDTDFDSLYFAADLKSEQGIAKSRARLGQSAIWLEAFSEVGADYRRAREEVIRNARLDEPLRTKLLEAFVTDQVSVARGQELWMEVQRGILTAAADILDFAESHLGTLDLDSAEFRALEDRSEAAGKRTRQAPASTLPDVDPLVDLLKAQLDSCRGCAAEAPSFAGMAWVSFESEDPAGRFARIVQLDRNGDFSMLDCLLTKGRDGFAISSGDPHRTYLGEWREDRQGYVAEYVKVDEKVPAVDATLAPLAQRSSVRVSIDGNGLLVGSERFTHMPEIPQQQYDAWMRGYRNHLGGKAQRALEPR
jgi:hypothetical protein